MGRLPWEKYRAILQFLENADITDNAGNFVKNIEWLNRNEIQAGLKKMGIGTVGRDEISNFLNDCYENESKYVNKRTAEREPKAKWEYKITDEGKIFLKELMSPNYEFINKRRK